MESFPSLPPPTAVLISLSYVSICTASPASQYAPLDSLLVVGICFQTLWEFVGAVGCICVLTQVGEGFVALCPEQSLRWHLRVLHVLFQLLPVFHSRGWFFARCQQILLQPLFWFGNQFPPSMGQFWEFCNRHARTSKTFPFSPKSFPLTYWICLCSQLGNKFRTQLKENAKALPRTLMRKW